MCKHRNQSLPLSIGCVPVRALFSSAVYVWVHDVNKTQEGVKDAKLSACYLTGDAIYKPKIILFYTPKMN